MLAVVLGPIILGVALGALFLMAMRSFLLPGRSGGGGRGPGILSSTVNQGIGYLFYKRLNRGAADVRVRRLPRVGASADDSAHVGEARDR